MPATKRHNKGWWVSFPNKGIVDVVSHETGKVVCSLSVSDYESLEDAKTMAEIIACLPKLLSPKLLMRLAKLMPKD